MGFITKYKIIAGTGFAIIIVLLGGFFLLKSKNSTPAAMSPKPTPESIYMIKPEDIGFSANPSQDKKSITMEITKLSGISSIDYEMDYKDIDNIPRGLFGTIDIKKTDTKISRDLLLGTCSKNVCKYDRGVKEVTFIVKVTYDTNKTGDLRQTIQL